MHGFPHDRDVNPRLSRVRHVLGRPVWEASGVALYQGDCLQLMRMLSGSILDLTVTSPPYNIGKVYERQMGLDDYVSWCTNWLDELHRLTVSDGALWLNLGYTSVPGRGKAVPLAYLLWQQVKFFLIQEIVWNYGAGVAARLMFSPRNEKWLWYAKDADRYEFNLDDVRDPNVKYPNQKKNGKVRVNPLGKNPSDVWQIPKVTTGQDRTGQRASPERTSHPAQFPEAVIERIIRACSHERDLLFDPFAGSGTTGAVAMKCGRSCILFETSSEYVDVAASRLERTAQDCSVSQRTLIDVARMEAEGLLRDTESSASANEPRV